MAMWTCPNCRRRVPGYAPVCHCGTRRSDATLVQEPSAQARLIPRARPRHRGRLSAELWLWVVGIVLIIALGVTWAVWPRKPVRIAPLLGTVDPPVTRSSRPRRVPPRPAPKPAPRPGQRK